MTVFCLPLMIHLAVCLRHLDRWCSPLLARQSLRECERQRANSPQSRNAEMPEKLPKCRFHILHCVNPAGARSMSGEAAKPMVTVFSIDLISQSPARSRSQSDQRR